MCNLPAPVDSGPPVLAGRLSATEPQEVLTEACSSTPVIEVAAVMVTNENILVLFERVLLSLLWALKAFQCWGSLTPVGLPSEPPSLLTSHNIMSPPDKSSPLERTVPHDI